MDAEFDRRWRGNVAPFDGVTVTLSESIELPMLQRALAVITLCLHTDWPHAHIFRLMDWHEHDGFVSIARPSSWE